MLPDVIDESILTRSIRREELFYAFSVFWTKFSGGLSLGLSTAAYKYVAMQTYKEICNAQTRELFIENTSILQAWVLLHQPLSQAPQKNE